MQNLLFQSAIIIEQLDQSMPVTATTWLIRLPRPIYLAALTKILTFLHFFKALRNRVLKNAIQHTLSSSLSILSEYKD